MKINKQAIQNKVSERINGIFSKYAIEQWEGDNQFRMGVFLLNEEEILVWTVSKNTRGNITVQYNRPGCSVEELALSPIIYITDTDDIAKVRAEQIYWGAIMKGLLK